MKRLTIALALLAVAAQGFGQAGAPRPWCGCAGLGQGRFGGFGQGPGYGRGGWWNRVSPSTSAEKAFVANAAKLHEQLRSANQKVMRLRAGDATETQISAAEAAADKIYQKVVELQTKNQALMRRMGANCPGNNRCFGRRGGRGWN